MRPWRFSQLRVLDNSFECGDYLMPGASCRGWRSFALAVRESALASRSADNVPYAYTDQESRESVDVP
jgi:hypothetical protein